MGTVTPELTSFGGIQDVICSVYIVIFYFSLMFKKIPKFYFIIVSSESRRI